MEKYCVLVNVLCGLMLVEKSMPPETFNPAGPKYTYTHTHVGEK